MAKKDKDRKTADQIEKEKRFAEIKVKLQAMVDTKKYEYMSEVSKAWNAKNKEKINESVKLGNTINFKFSGGTTVSVLSDYLCLG